MCAGHSGEFSSSPKFSLVLVTLGRTAELERFLLHLEAQRYGNVEVIVVDQNSDDRLIPILERFESRLPIVRLRSGRGLSRGRNVGLNHATGDVVGFPDDDCWYPETMLLQMASVFENNPQYDGITARPVHSLIHSGYDWFDRQSGPVDKFNVWRRATSYTIFLRRCVVRSVGPFDESLGVGSESGRISAEEIDYLLRALEHRFSIWFHSDVYICHAEPTDKADGKLIHRGYGYSLGLGAVLRKHHYPAWFAIYLFVRALAGVSASLCTLNFVKAQYHYAVLRGRIRGWLT